MPLQHDFARMQIGLKRWRLAGIIGFALSVIGMSALALELRDLRRQINAKSEVPSELVVGTLRCFTLSADTIRVTQIEVPGADGKPAAVLGAGTLVLGSLGNGQVALSARPGAQEISLTGNRSAKRIHLSVDAEGVPGVSLSNSTGEAAKLSLGPLGDAFVQVRNRNGAVRVIAADE